MPEESWLCDSVFVVEGFLSPQECEKYIRISEDIGFEEALVSSPEGHVLRADVRDNQRVMFENRELAASLWERAQDFVPVEFDGRIAVGVNELLRFYRYDPGQSFDWHQDFPHERDNGEKSYFTFMIYLSDEFEGGETSFEDSYSEESFDDFQVKPQLGMALFFEHGVHHKGEPVRAGRKYVLRTDVMYSSEDAEDDDYQTDDDDEFDEMDDDPDEQW